MKDLKIVPLDLKTDIPQIAEWETKYKNHKGYKAIEHFILEDNTYYSLAEVIEINHEMYPIGEDERKHALAIKNKENNLVGFVLATIMDKTTPSPCMFLQYVVISPEFQGQGFGKKTVKEITENAEQYFDVPITEFFGYVHNQNYHSMKLMLDLGASLKAMEKSSYYRAIKYMPKLDLDKE